MSLIFDKQRFNKLVIKKNEQFTYGTYTIIESEQLFKSSHKLNDRASYFHRNFYSVNQQVQSIHM